MLKVLLEQVNYLTVHKDTYLQDLRNIASLTEEYDKVKRHISRCNDQLRQMEAQCLGIPVSGVQERTTLKDWEEKLIRELKKPRLFGKGKKQELEASLQVIRVRLEELDKLLDKANLELEFSAALMLQDELNTRVSRDMPALNRSVEDYEGALKQLAALLPKLSDEESAIAASHCVAISSLLPMDAIRILFKDAPSVHELPVDVQIKLLYGQNRTIRFAGRDWNVVRIWKDKALLLSRLLVQPAYGRRPDDWVENRLLEETSPQERSVIQPTDGKLFWNLWDVQVRNWLQSWNLVTDGNWWLARDEDGPNVQYLCYVSTRGNIHKVSPYEYVSAPSSYRPVVCVSLDAGSVDADWEALWVGRDGFLDCTGYWKMEKEADAWVPDYRNIEARAEAILHPNKADYSGSGTDLLSTDRDYFGYPSPDYSTDV